MLADVCRAAGDGSPVPSPAADARETLSGLLLCAASLRRQDVAEEPDGDLHPWQTPDARRAARQAGPAAAVRSDESCRAADAAPRFSIVVPCIEHRGMAEPCLAGWLAQEQFPGEGFELLWVSDAAHDDVADWVAGQLRGQDRLLRSAGSNRSELYDAGARAARGEFVVFTESHCVPEPDFLIELDRRLQSERLDVACCRSMPTAYNALAVADADAFEGSYRLFRRDSDWRKINVQACAVRREAYFAAGGLPGRYGQYAEMVLADRLRSLGQRMGYVPGAAVWHHYRASVAEVLEQIDDYALGELRYQLDWGCRDPIAFTHLAPALRPVSPAIARSCLAAAWKRLRDGLSRGDLTALACLWRHGRDWLKVCRLARWRNEARVFLLSWWCRLTQRHRGLAQGAYRRLFYAAVERAWLRNAGRGDLLPAPIEPLSFPIARHPEEWLLGFHLPETSPAGIFRWSRPVAGIDLTLRPGRYEIVVETGTIRPWPGSLRWSFDNHELSAEEIRYESDAARLTVDVLPNSSRGRHTLAWRCAAWDVDDPRPLGLPVFSVAGRPLAAGMTEDAALTEAPAVDQAAGSAAPAEADSATLPFVPAATAALDQPTRRAA